MFSEGPGDSQTINDSDKDYIDMEDLLDDFPESQDLGSPGKKKLSTVEQINNFLDVTKNVRKPLVEDFSRFIFVFLHIVQWQ